MHAHWHALAHTNSLTHTYTHLLVHNLIVLGITFSKNETPQIEKKKPKHARMA